MIRQTRQIALEADFVLHLDEIPCDELRVVGLAGEEALGEFFRFRLELTSESPDLDPAELLGRTACLDIHGASGTRHVHGIVGQFERTGNGRTQTYYAAEIVPEHWLLTQRFQSRIFQEHNCPDMSVPGIIERVFDTAGILDDRYRFELYGDYKERDYVVQYRETDANFVRRLMEEEGIYFFFEQTPDGCCLLMADLPNAHKPLADEVVFPFRDPNGLVSEEDAELFDQLRERRSIGNGAVALDDFNFRTPGANLLRTRTGKAFTALEHSDYPGEFVDKDRGGRLAQVRLESLACRNRAIELVGNIRSLTPGFTFQLSDHSAQRLNCEYLLTRVRHSALRPQGAEAGAAGGDAHYRVEVEVLPAEIPFRLQQDTPRPVVRGSQTAIVVGPKDEEIHTDKYGRIKVQFHWDRDRRFDDSSSYWIRVSQGMAGGGYGMMFLPHVGQEVIMDFLEGNPDRPIITGRVYNNDHMPAYRLPEEKTRSYIKTNTTKGGKGTNEICFEDRKDHEQLLLFAQRDLHLRAANDRRENIGRDRHLTVKRDKIELVKENKHVDIVLDLVERVGGNKSLEVIGDVAEQFANHSEKAHKYSLTAAGGAVIDSATGITLRCGANSITIDRTGVWISGTHIGLNTGGSPLAAAPQCTQQPLEALEADSAEPGRDVNYAAQPPHAPAIDDACDQQNGGADDARIKTSWIELEMIDEIGEPWPGECFEIVEPDGEVTCGALDKEGRAHVAVRNPGLCKIRFPKLDKDAWRCA